MARNADPTAHYTVEKNLANDGTELVHEWRAELSRDRKSYVSICRITSDTRYVTAAGVKRAAFQQFGRNSEDHFAPDYHMTNNLRHVSRFGTRPIAEIAGLDENGGINTHGNITEHVFLTKKLTKLVTKKFKSGMPAGVVDVKFLNVRRRRSWADINWTKKISELQSTAMNTTTHRRKRNEIFQKQMEYASLV